MTPRWAWSFRGLACFYKDAASTRLYSPEARFLAPGRFDRPGCDSVRSPLGVRQNRARANSFKNF